MTLDIFFAGNNKYTNRPDRRLNYIMYMYIESYINVYQRMNATFFRSPVKKKEY